MIYKQSFKLESRHRAVSFHDVTDKVKEIFAASRMKDGIVVVYSHHTTCSVITQECAFDTSMTGLETLQQDLVNVTGKWNLGFHVESLAVGISERQRFANEQGLALNGQTLSVPERWGVELNCYSSGGHA